MAAFCWLSPQIADADGSTTCTTHGRTTGSCTTTVTIPGSKSPNQGTGSRTRSGSVSQACTTKAGKSVPCKSKDGGWYSARECYARRAAPELQDVARARPGFSLYTCKSIYGEPPVEVELPDAAVGPPPPDPRVLSGRAVASMGLRAVKIGIVPEDRPDRVGLVGLPAWMWVADRGPSTWGPISRTAAERGFAVTATARVQRVVWSMGDGSVVVCVKPGTPYRNVFGARSSPDCGYRYVKQGVYTVRATSYWLVTWTGIGQTGTIPLDFTASTVISVGEAQVLTR